MQNVSPVWILFGAIGVLVILVALRLGVKSANLTETDIITHYSAQYVQQGEKSEDLHFLTDCYAISASELWIRLEVVCTPQRGGDSIRYLVGHWGQLLRTQTMKHRSHAPSI